MLRNKKRNTQRHNGKETAMKENETTIQDAIAQTMERHVLLEIRYVDKHGKETVRLVRPDSVKGTRQHNRYLCYGL